MRHAGFRVTLHVRGAALLPADLPASHAPLRTERLEFRLHPPDVTRGKNEAPNARKHSCTPLSSESTVYEMPLGVSLSVSTPLLRLPGPLVVASSPVASGATVLDVQVVDELAELLARPRGETPQPPE